MRAIAALLAVTLAWPAAALKPAAPPEEGAKAPAFSLRSQDGKAVSLAAYKGSWVVLYFYPKDFTGGCTLEARGFQKKLAQFQARNAHVLGVSGQDEASHKAFCEQEGLNFKLLADDGLKVAERYGSVMARGDARLAARNTFLIGPDGKVARRWLGVKPEGHPEMVLAALQELAREPVSPPGSPVP